MRKFLIPIVAAASTLAIAAPASAQWAPPVYRYAPYNFGYGYSGIRFAQAMHARVLRIRSDIRAMAVRRIITPWQARSLEMQAASIDRKIYRSTGNGIQPGEARSIERQIGRLEFRVSNAAAHWHRGYGAYRRY